MFIAPKSRRALLRSEERTVLCICKRCNVRSPNEAGGGEGLIYKHVAPLGHGSATNFGTTSLSF